MSLASLFRFSRRPQGAGDDPVTAPAVSARRDRAELATHLFGDGIEIGALNAPLALGHNPRVKRVRYVDRYGKDELLRLFPELEGVRSKIVETDIKCEVIQGLAPIEDASVDFVIACHLIEHVPDPIFFLDECRRVLRPGGVLFLAAPERNHSSFDAKRPVTPLKHLIEDHGRRIREVEDHHLEEFLVLAENTDIPTDPAARQALLDHHRGRSIHIHVWDLPAFCEFLSHCVRTSAPFALVDAAGPQSTERNEMAIVLRKIGPGEQAPDFEAKLRARLDPAS